MDINRQISIVVKMHQLEANDLCVAIRLAIKRSKDVPFECLEKLEQFVNGIEDQSK